MKRKFDYILLAALIMVVFCLLATMIFSMTGLQRCAMNLWEVLTFWHSYCGG